MPVKTYPKKRVTLKALTEKRGRTDYLTGLAGILLLCEMERTLTVSPVKHTGFAEEKHLAS